MDIHVLVIIQIMEKNAQTVIHKIIVVVSLTFHVYVMLNVINMIFVLHMIHVIIIVLVIVIQFVLTILMLILVRQYHANVTAFQLLHVQLMVVVRLMLVLNVYQIELALLFAEVIQKILIVLLIISLVDVIHSLI